MEIPIRVDMNILVFGSFRARLADHMPIFGEHSQHSLFYRPVERFPVFRWMRPMSDPPHSIDQFILMANHQLSDESYVPLCVRVNRTINFMCDKTGRSVVYKGILLDATTEGPWIMSS